MALLVQAFAACELRRGLAPPPARCLRPTRTTAGPDLSRVSARCAGAPYVVRIWDSEGGALHAVGEAAPGLLAPLAWQPNGRHLYAAAAPAPAAQRSASAGPAAQGRAQARGGEPAPGKVAAASGSAQGQSAEPKRGVPAAGAARVLLFERNGLRHGGFDLPSPGACRYQACGHRA